ncbi:MAG: DUF3943 domain-containing protein [Myxococcota bacterium]|nr:DUF3943 domain-containing protein [Myxococcota bacterium]
MTISIAAHSQAPVDPQCASSPCKKSFLVPVIRIAALETSMHFGMLAIWPEAFDITDTGKNAMQFRSSWSSFPEYRHAANIFASDGDWWHFNLITHGLFGSEAYLAARSWRHKPVIAFVYAVIASFAWEYVVEAWYQHPSAIDLFWTPMGGAMLGEIRFQALRASRRIASPGWRTVVGIILDPLGELERMIMGCDLCLCDLVCSKF